MADKKSSIRSVVKSILALLKTNMPSIVEGYDDFPTPTQKLKYPSFSVFTQTPEFIPSALPYVVKNLGKITTPGDPNLGKSKILYCTGHEEFVFQVDFWCSTKPERHYIYEEFKNAINAIAPAAGTNIKLTDYYDEFIHVFFGKISFADDSEIGSQRGEWRLKVDVTVNIRALQEKLENVIETVETTVETTASDEFEDASSGTDYLNNTI